MNEPIPTRATRYQPTNKVTVGLLASSIVTLVLKVLGHYGIVFGADETAAVHGIVLFLIQWWVPDAQK